MKDCYQTLPLENVCFGAVQGLELLLRPMSLVSILAWRWRYSWDTSTAAEMALYRIKIPCLTSLPLLKSNAEHLALITATRTALTGVVVAPKTVWGS